MQSHTSSWLGALSDMMLCNQRSLLSPSSGSRTKPSKKQAASMTVKMEVLHSLETCTEIYCGIFQKTTLFINLKFNAKLIVLASHDLVYGRGAVRSDMKVPPCALRVTVAAVFSQRQ
jgi:hypothetical protein